jgi:hypothetical protein
MAGLLDAPPMSQGLLTTPRTSFATMYPGVGMDTDPLRSMTPEMREYMIQQATRSLAPSQFVQGMVGGAADLAMQANQAMPWGGNDPSAIGIDTQAGTIDPSVMVPFASNVAGMVEAGGFGATAARGPMKDALGVMPVPAAKASPIPTAATFPDELVRAVKATPGAEMTPDGVVISVRRNQRPEQAGEASVRGGVFYLPEGSKDLKFYNGKNWNAGYGGSQPIKGQTLYKNPLVVKGATGGKAPQAAFDQINGKGAYEAMRLDALQSMPPYYLKDQGLRNELVSRFLNQYAPEMINYTDVILEKSTKGNQLAYALQEAAVASAVRKAGYDGVLGYSVSRNTKEPFISEVFDVREDMYPTPEGDYSVWPQYEPRSGGGF